MKRRRHTLEQIIRKLREADRMLSEDRLGKRALTRARVALTAAIRPASRTAWVVAKPTAHA